MTPFETHTLDIAHQTLVIQIVSIAIALAALIAAIVAGITIWLQLRASQWNAMLQFEMDMNSRWRDLADIAGEVQAQMPEMTESQRRLLLARKSVLEESYLNSVDRFSSSILNGQFPAEKLKADYRGFIESALRDFPNAYGPGTRLRNTVKLHNKWAD